MRSTRPSNGAVTVVKLRSSSARSSSALALSTLALATSTWARAWSASSWLTAPVPRAFSVRAADAWLSFRVAAAFSTAAFALATVAWNGRGSIRTSLSPSLTSAPSLKNTRSTYPLTRGRTSAVFTAAMVPVRSV
ncbi:MAG: hypothetical protein U0871_06315 [Gemmataceae bacterium]